MLCSSLLLAGYSNAATVLVSDNFETSLGSWSTSGGATLYTYSGTGHNYASGGSGAANLPKAGGAITLTNALPLLDTATDDFVTISFDWQRLNATTTRFLNLEYAADGVNFTTLARHATGTNATIFSGSVTLTKNANGTVSHAVGGNLGIQNGSAVLSFTDTAKFRIIDTSSAGADVRSYVDNISITSSIPEPTTALLSSLGLLALFRRRR